MPSDAGAFRQTLDELDVGFYADAAAFVHRKRPMNMVDKARVLKILVDRPQDAVGLCSRLGVSANTLFSLLRKMEKEDLIVWNGQEWAAKPSTDSGHPSEGGPNA